MALEIRCARLFPLLAIAAIACGGGDDGEETGPGAGTEGTAPARYELTTEIDLTEVAGAETAVGGALEPLRKFQENPGKAILEQLTAKSVPIVAALTSKLPGPIESKFAEWFGDELAGAEYEGVPASEALGAVGDDLAAMATKFEILSTLDRDPQTGQSAAHRIVGMAFTRAGERVLVDAPDLVGAVKPAENVGFQVTGGDAELGAHGFSLPIGDLTSRGLDLFNKDKLARTGLRFVIGRIVDCDGRAKKLAQRCVAGLCVGHETEIKQLCDAGLDVVTDVTLLGLKRLNLDPLTLVSGNAKILDATVPGDGGLLEGVWRGTVDLGEGPRDITSKFLGKRVPSLP